MLRCGNPPASNHATPRPMICQLPDKLLLARDRVLPWRIPWQTVRQATNLNGDDQCKDEIASCDCSTGSRACRHARTTLRDYPTWCPRVFELLMQFEQTADMILVLPHDYARYLGRHGYRAVCRGCRCLRARLLCRSQRTNGQWRHAAHLRCRVAVHALRSRGASGGRANRSLGVSVLPLALPWRSGVSPICRSIFVPTRA